MEAWKLLVLISAKESAAAASRNRETQKQEERGPTGAKAKQSSSDNHTWEGGTSIEDLPPSDWECLCSFFLIANWCGRTQSTRGSTIPRQVCKKASWASLSMSQKAVFLRFLIHAPVRAPALTSLHYQLWPGSARWKQHLSSKLPLVTGECRL